MADNQFTCQVCGEKFQSKEELDSHVQQTHGKKEQHQQEHSMICTKCGLKAKASDELEQHSCPGC